jgi:hypothetical protein
VTGLLVVLALFAFCGWLYFSRRSATGLPALLVYDDAGRNSSGRWFHTVSVSRAARTTSLRRPQAWSLSNSNPARVRGLDRMPLMWPS